MTMAIIGLGGAGGNIANEATILGLPTGAINFSQKDLDSLDKVKNKLKILGSEGVGHNRDIAIELIKENYMMVIDFIKENFSNSFIDILAFSFSTGGGSGSGIAPIVIDIISSIMPEKTIIAIPIIPDVSETTISQSNCSSTFEELLRLDVCIFPIDNQEVKSSNMQMGKGKIYESTNTYIIDKLFKLISYTEKHSKNGNFDRKDFVTLLKQKGMAVIAETNITCIPESDLSPEGIAASIQESWEQSIFAKIEYDHVSKAGVIFDGQESIMGLIDHSLIFDKFTNGTPIDLFEGNYHEQNGMIMTILTGLPWCKTRLGIVDNLVEEGSLKVEVSIGASENQDYKSKSKDLTTKFRQPNQAKQSVNDILNRYKR
jgi:cell division GTPase FtsZ